ncbi:MAG TPA: hypothetical protein VKV40_24430 [Ktedonobacteraceae bacterium]|nr:hypothetical protein [Ktedonobacteraceae bacterium]
MADEQFSRPADGISSGDIDVTVPDLPLRIRSSTAPNGTISHDPTIAIWPPPYPMYRRHETLSPATLAFIIVLVTLLFAGGLSLASYSATEQYRTNLNTQAALEAQATERVYASVTAQVQATSQVLATVQAHIDATATAQANAIATATAQVNQATATATAFQGMLSTVTSGTAALDDSLSDNTQHNHWDEGATKTGHCIFTKNAYQASESLQGYLQPCIAESTDFSNLVYQVQLSITQGNQGGILFRADGANGTFYLFRVGTDGSYAFDLYNGSKHSATLASGYSTAITTGLNQSNQLAVYARGSTFSLFANGQYITSLKDGTLSSGQIGVAALDYNVPSQVTFSNARVWIIS